MLDPSFASWFQNQLMVYPSMTSIRTISFYDESISGSRIHDKQTRALKVMLQIVQSFGYLRTESLEGKAHLNSFFFFVC